MAVKHWIVFTVVKTKTGSWARTLLASGGAVWGVCPYTDHSLIPGTDLGAGAVCKQSV